MIYLQLFYTFLKVGILGFGSNYTLMALSYAEIVTTFKWLSPAQFTNIIALSQTTPDMGGFNIAAYMGYYATLQSGYTLPMAILGGAVACLACMIPSFLLICLVSIPILKRKEQKVLDSIFTLFRPAMLGVIIALIVLLASTGNFGSRLQNPWQFYISIFLFVSTFIGIRCFKINAFQMVALCGISGLILL